MMTRFTFRSRSNLTVNSAFSFVVRDLDSNESRSRGHRLHKQPPIDFVVARSANDDARRDIFLEQFRRAFGSFMQSAAKHHHRICLHRSAVHGQNLLREKIGGSGKQDY